MTRFSVRSILYKPSRWYLESHIVNSPTLSIFKLRLIEFTLEDMILMSVVSCLLFCFIIVCTICVVHTVKPTQDKTIRASPSPPFDNIQSCGDCLAVKRKYYLNCVIYCQRATSSMGTVNKNSLYSPVGPWVFLFFLGCMIYLYIGVCFVLPWTVESFPFMFWRWRNKLKWAPSSFFLLPPH